MARKERTTIDLKKLTPERRKLWNALEATSKAFADVPVEELQHLGSYQGVQILSAAAFVQHVLTFP